MRASITWIYILVSSIINLCWKFCIWFIIITRALAWTFTLLWLLEPLCSEYEYQPNLQFDLDPFCNAQLSNCEKLRAVTCKHLSPWTHKPWHFGGVSAVISGLLALLAKSAKVLGNATWIFKHLVDIIWGDRLRGDTSEVTSMRFCPVNPLKINSKTLLAHLLM